MYYCKSHDTLRGKYGLLSYEAVSVKAVGVYYIFYRKAEIYDISVEQNYIYGFEKAADIDSIRHI